MTRSISGADVMDERGRPDGPHRLHAVYVYDVDGTVYEYDQPTISGAQIMLAAGLDPQQGLIHILSDGYRVTVTASETVNLCEGAHFKRRPRFKRG
jgi:tryptophanyl-tRNA synthetase